MKKTSFTGKGMIMSYIEFALIISLVFALGALSVDLEITKGLLTKPVPNTVVVLDVNNRTCFDEYNSQFIMRDNTKANGFYNYEGFFCVVTKDRTLEEITKTTIHELGHLFVHDNYPHFCNEKLEKGAVNYPR